jgi:L-cysteine desulfidase
VDFAGYLAGEWRVALGCTEPAAIAYAASSAAALAGGPIRAVRLICDPRIYKNCYAVGIPGSGHKVGIRWALAIGALLPEPALRLECFKRVDQEILERAGQLLEDRAVTAKVDPSRRELWVDCQVVREGGTGRALIAREHTRLVRLERDGAALPLPEVLGSERRVDVRAELAALPFGRLIELACSLGEAERASLQRGAELNLAIARHGLSLFPQRFVDMAKEDPLTRISRLVCAGVYARMWGEDFAVMSLAGSGNKGIVCSVPLVLWGRECGLAAERIAQALALAALVTSATTHHLGALSAVCGCSNAAGIGLAAGLCLLEGGGPEQISLAVNNMVGNVTGMICDGAKIGCALKTMTAVDAAFRAVRLATCGIGIPKSDGIVGEDGLASLRNLGRIANQGMISTDAEILAIMQEKME